MTRRVLLHVGAPKTGTSFVQDILFTHRDALRDRGILYAPDYLVNAGGVIQVEDERHGFSFARAQSKASGIFDVALRVFRLADADGISPAVAADRLAEERIRSVGRLATIRLPR